MSRRRWPGAWALLAACLIACLAPVGVTGAAEPRIRLKVLGNLAATGQYEDMEAGFWRDRVPALTGGRVTAEVSPFDRSGLRAQEVLPLLRLGVVGFATVPVTVASSDEPRLGAADLPMLSPDIATLDRMVAAWRPEMEALLRERYESRLLAFLPFPAQVPFCTRPIARLQDLQGRRVRTSSAPQALLVRQLGGTPITLPYAESPRAVSDGVVDCVITGTTPGLALGLHRVAPHVLAEPVSWGLSVMVVGEGAWQALPTAERMALQGGIATLQQAFWEQAARDTEGGLSCAAGSRSCAGESKARGLVVHPASPPPDLQALRLDLVREWARRCGPGCAAAWNRRMAEPSGLRLAED